MPLGLWKSKWEIHREEMARYQEDIARYREDMARRDEEWRQETMRRDLERREDKQRWEKESERREKLDERREKEWREESERYREEVREERAQSDEHWRELGEECRDLRLSYAQELEKSRRSTEEILARMETNERNIEAALKIMGEQIVAMRKEVHENTDAVKAQTQAIFKLVDRFEDPERQPPL